MGGKLGIKYFGGQPFQDIPITSITGQDLSKSAMISLNDWQAIVNYYSRSSPAKLPYQNRPPVQQVTNLFRVKEYLSRGGIPPATSYVKIDPGNHWIYTGNGFDSSVNIYNDHLGLIAKDNVHSVVVDMQLQSSLE